MRIVLQALFLNVAINGGFVDVSPGKTLSLEEILQMSLKNVVSPNTTVLNQGTSQELPKVKFNHVNEGDYSIPEINEKSGVNKGNKHLFQGDILLTELRIIGVFVKGAMLWQKDSCLNFVYNPIANDRIKVMKGQGCLAAIGKNGGEQLLSLGQGCDS
ncbi:hypothetical protein OSTOST_18783, partial [Ostertagia ostertagi]